jgi:hypothetical protein
MGGEDMPSIATVVGSMDASATRYAARVSMQTGRQEIIVDLKGMVSELSGLRWMGVGWSQEGGWPGGREGSETRWQVG